MPPKKSNLNNARSREARRKRDERAHQSAEQIATRNAAQKIRTTEGRAQESQEQRDARLRQTITRTRAARERNITTARVQEQQRQRTSRSLKLLQEMSNVISAEMKSSEVCICCLREAIEQPNTQVEECTTLLKDVFNIMVQTDPKIHLVCDACIQTLRNARAFKMLASKSLKQLGIFAVTEQLGFTEVPIKEEAPETYENYYDTVFEEDVIKFEPKEEVEDNVGENLNDMDALNNKEKTPSVPVETSVVSGTPVDKTKDKKLAAIRRKLSEPEREKLNNDACYLMTFSNIVPFTWYENLYLCIVCEKPFHDINLLRYHTENYHKKSHLIQNLPMVYDPVKADITNLKCENCNSAIDNVEMLRTHFKNGCRFRSDWCLESDKDCFQYYKFGTETFDCQYCSSKFKMFKQLNEHMYEHLAFECRVCKKRFENNLALQAHEKRHLKQANVCKICNLKFFTRFTKVRHLREFHVHNYKLEPNYKGKK